MPDPNVLVREYLLLDLTLVALVGDSIFAGILPDRYDPTTAPAIVVCAQGGSSHIEAPLVDDRIQVKVWAGVNEAAQARQIYEEIHNWLHGATGIDMGNAGFLIRSVEASRGSSLPDPDTGWATVVSYFQVEARESAGSAVTLLVDGGTF